MEVTTQSLNSTKLPFFYYRPSAFANYNYVTFCGFNCSKSPKQCIKISGSSRKVRGVIHASSSTTTDESISTDNRERWLLQPVGDGDSRHIGFKVPMPDAYEISSSVVTVGRVPEKADLVIPVATVSGLHARLQMVEGSLVVTDLNSTNGTFIDDKRLSPNVPATIPSGRYLTFGDTNLAIFRVSKLKKSVVVSEESGESEAEEKVGAEAETETATSKGENKM